jgi:ribosomal protein S28E/S33
MRPSPKRSSQLPPRRPVTTDANATLDDTIVDAEEEEPETGPMRRCLVTRERLPKEQMFRFVVSPERALIPDLAGKLPGRGIWLSASRDVIEGRDGTTRGVEGRGAKGRELVRAIARAARGPVQVPSDLLVVLETALIRRIGDFLGLARRAGQAIAGFEKARDWMQTHPVGLVLQAADGSKAERARFRSAVQDAVPVLDPLTGAELGRVFGHDTVVHVALAPGRLAGSIAIDTGRLAGLRTTSAQRIGPATGRETAEINDATDTNG